MKSVPTVAVITRTKDRTFFLRRSILSVLGQSFQDWHHVIVNDGGNPQEVDVLVSSYKEAYDGRVTVVHHAESKGMQIASNAGLEAVDSTYLIIHDDDDSWYPDFLEVTVSFLEKQGVDSLVQGVAAQTTQVFEEVTVTGEILEISRRPYYPFGFINFGEMRRRNIFAPITFLFRRSAQEKVGLFRQEFDVLGDHDFNLRFLRHFEIGVISTYHAKYHWRQGSLGNTVTRGLDTHRKMLNRMKNVYLRESLDHPETAPGDIEEVEFPPPQTAPYFPFHYRESDGDGAKEIPNFRETHNFEVLSLDVFDTVLKRRCHRPRDLFRLLESEATALLNLPSKPYALARVEAERRARKFVQEELILSDIYAELGRMLELKEEETQALQNLELNLEKRMLYADPRWLDLYRAYRSDGVRVIFVSDMYLSGKQIAAFLSDCGFKEPEVYSSSDYGVSKHDGKLQSVVAKAIGVSGANILHVGDNYHSDCLRALQAGWQGFHWSSNFEYTPWAEEVAPYYYQSEDLLSTRILGEIRRNGMKFAGQDQPLSLKLGYEVAGPFYLSYLLWVLREAKKDGIRQLVLVGRDGYYWEKALKEIAASHSIEIEFNYFHASRKVFNFASFQTLSEEALTFLLTPNPALRVRDFIDRTGLSADDYVDAMRIAGFPDPDQVLTKEMGGDFLSSHYAHQLRNLFLFLKAELENLFAKDREGMLKQLQEVQFDPDHSAFVDVGWNASNVRTIARLLEVEKPHRILGYFLGTWKEADPGNLPVEVRSFFMEFGKPDEHFWLLRESVNWIESIHSAPYSTLVALALEEDKVVPHFSPSTRSGFPVEEQKLIWTGAEAFLRDILKEEMPALGAKPGFNYLYLVLFRVLREPSPREVKAWGQLEHSEGFGLEVYKRLIEPVSDETMGEDLMAAYRGSNWKRGFLSALIPWQRKFVVERIEPQVTRTYEELQGDLRWKTQQADSYWVEKEKANHRIYELETELKRMHGENAQLNQLKTVALEKITEISEWHRKLWEQQQAVVVREAEMVASMKAIRLDRDALKEETNRLNAEKAQLKQELDHKLEILTELEKTLRSQMADSEAEKSSLQSQIELILENKSQIENSLDIAQAEIQRLEKLLSSKASLLKVFFGKSFANPSEE